MLAIMILSQKQLQMFPLVAHYLFLREPLQLKSL
nr:MAG TPA: hypothetical protein [Caudoviricetes sp.]